MRNVNKSSYFEKMRKDEYFFCLETSDVITTLLNNSNDQSQRCDL